MSGIRKCQEFFISGFFFEFFLCRVNIEHYISIKLNKHFTKELQKI